MNIRIAWTWCFFALVVVILVMAALAIETDNHPTGNTNKTIVAEDSVTPSELRKSRLRYMADFDTNDFDIKERFTSISQDTLGRVFQKAIKQKDWFIINYIAEEFADTYPGSKAKTLVEDRVTNYKANHVIDITDKPANVPQGGVGVMSRNISRPFNLSNRSMFPSYSFEPLKFSLVFDNTLLPLELNVRPLSLDLEERQFRVAIIVDPEARMGKALSFPLTARVNGPKPAVSRGSIDDSGKYVPDGEYVSIAELSQCMDYEIEIHVDKEAEFDSGTVLDIYLTATSTLRQVGRKNKELDAVFSKLNVDNVKEIGGTVQRLGKEIKELIQEAGMYQYLLKCATLHRKKNISDVARQALIAMQMEVLPQQRIVILTRGTRQKAQITQQVSSEQRFAELRSILERLGQATQLNIGSSLPGDGAKRYPNFHYEGRETYFELYRSWLFKNNAEYLKEMMDSGDFDHIVHYLNADGSPGARAILEHWSEKMTTRE